MSELDIITKTIEAALAANEASSNALRAVLRLLGKPNTSPEIQNSTTETTTETTTDEECQHQDAIPVSTGAGTFLVCGCGWQN